MSIVIESDNNSKVFLDSNGKLYRKQYNEYGGVGSMRIPKIFYFKQIRKINLRHDQV